MEFIFKGVRKQKIMVMTNVKQHWKILINLEKQAVKFYSATLILNRCDTDTQRVKIHI